MIFGVVFCVFCPQRVETAAPCQKIFIFLKNFRLPSRTISVKGERRRRLGVTKTEFTAFVGQYERLVYTICFQFVRDSAAAEDLTQETFLSAYLHMDACPAGYERQWLGRIAANKCKDHLQSAWSRRVDLDGGEAQAAGLSPPAEETALRRMELDEARSAVAALPEPYGSVCRLCLLEERSAEEAAVVLGRPVKTVYTQLDRGKKILRQKLKGRQGHEALSK